MKKPVWLNIHHVLGFHFRQIRQHGGLHGVRDEGLLESALMRPQQLFHYEKTDVYALAASYAYSIVKNHPFVDGNKRAAIITAGVFLEMNGIAFEAEEPEVVNQVTRLAAGELSEKECALWLRQVSRQKTRR